MISFHIDDEKLLKNIKLLGLRLKNEWNALPVYDDRYIKTKIRTYSDKAYTNFHGLNVPEDDIKCECFTIIAIDSLFLYKKKYYLQVYFDNCTYKIIDKSMIHYFDENPFETGNDKFLINRSYKCCTTIELI